MSNKKKHLSNLLSHIRAFYMMDVEYARRPHLSRTKEQRTQTKIYYYTIYVWNNFRIFKLIFKKRYFDEKKIRQKIYFAENQLENTYVWEDGE